MRHRSIDTALVHAGAPRPRLGGSVVPPIFQSANFEMADEAEYHGVRYARLSNSPTHLQLGEKLAAIEGAEAAIATASGMAAITAALLSVVGAGDHVLVQQNVYGGTATLLSHDAARLGVSHTAVDAARPDTWAAALRPNTRAFYVEGVSNPLMRVADLPAVVAFSREAGLTTIIDNTFLSPVNLRPVELGFDLVVHSATKYLNGHSDLCAGVIAGNAERVQAAHHLQNHLGGHLDAHACFLLDRGLKTLGLRVRRQNQSAARIAAFLAEHPAVDRVHYPGLPGHPGHALASAVFSGFGGMLAFETRTDEAADRFVRAVGLFLHAASLGGVESLVVRPSRSSHLGMDPAEREALGITDRLVRVSIGLEDPDDLVDDLRQALAA